MTTESIHDVAVTNDLRFLWLEITAKCNLTCSHCYADSGPDGPLYGRMSYGDWTRVIDESAELGCRSVQFIGGEPTMHPRLDDMVDHANHRGFQFIEVFTNATRLDKELVGCFQRRGVHVATSFYSDDSVVHDQVTERSGSWRRTVSGIEAVLAAGLPIRVCVIETERNTGHGPRAVEFLKTLGVQEVRIDRTRGVGRGAPVYPVNGAERYEELCGQCWKGKLCVTSTGEVFPCVFARATPLGEVKAGLAGILQSARLTGFRRRIRTAREIVLQCGPGCAPGDCPPAAPCAPDQCPPFCPCNPSECGPNGH
jgi:MoaA/NifB/PqqE/SkfB family radical SAM enzyme